MASNEHITAEETQTSSVFDLIKEHDHEQVIFCNDPDSGLNAIIAIHSTILGPSLGGTRMWNYGSDREALVDVFARMVGL